MSIESRIVTVKIFSSLTKKRFNWFSKTINVPFSSNLRRVVQFLQVFAAIFRGTPDMTDIVNCVCVQWIQIQNHFFVCESLHANGLVDLYESAGMSTNGMNGSFHWLFQGTQFNKCKSSFVLPPIGYLVLELIHYSYAYRYSYWSWHECADAPVPYSTCTIDPIRQENVFRAHSPTTDHHKLDKYWTSVFRCSLAS